MTSDLQALKQMTESLPKMGDFVQHVHNGNITLGALGSAGTIFNLFYDTQVSVDSLWLQQGDRLPRHDHLVSEWLIVYEGRISVRSNGKPLILSVGESVVSRPHQTHAILALEDSKIIRVSVPAEDELTQ